MLEGVSLVFVAEVRVVGVDRIVVGENGKAAVGNPGIMQRGFGGRQGQKAINEVTMYGQI